MANSYADAISGIESGGRYNLLGPQTKGDRAYGRYQVMGANVPSWTQQYYGQSLTPQEFLNNPAAQDAVFNGKFGEYAQKYGPEGAAKAWFAGEGGMNNPNAKDVLGTTVASYGRQFTNAMGGQAPDQPQMASNAPSYSDTFNKPELVPGAAAPALPPPITIGGQPQQGMLAGNMPQQPGQQGGLLGGNPMQLASAGMGLMSGIDGNKPITPQPFVGAPVRPRVDMSSLMQFLASANRPTSWGA